ncbi:polysaccharide deacetylase family protein [Umezawaea endophytica]|uniref:Polysaccharide deacetylase family protein n=1 Tax=Umezawaea endophytica TaxID=1654476 RepID=A0A9X2VTV6_9PSEU|nr:polysaccharide deacetylase family protein [Umezawaea endophytica]MCS7482019.1 polysaccharide deacetylase family protein [Umezawaea endophytica]
MRRSPRRRRWAVITTAVLFSAPGCGTGGSPVVEAVGSSALPGPSATSSSRAPEPAEVGANELGEVPVLMYHRVVRNPASVYDRDPTEFRAELRRLATEGYVPVTAADFAAGEIDIPAGAHPVVLTFDDGDPSQFALGRDGAPDPDTAVGILLRVAAEHPGFRPVASLYVNAEPFGGTSMTWLRDNGFEIGNHTHDHADLSGLDGAGVQREIARGQAAIERAVPGYRVSSLALPFGSAPQDPALALRGASEGVSYDHRCVFLVGAEPSPSPYAQTFDPSAVPRVRSQGPTGEDAAYGSSVRLDELASDPGRRYTSDGRADRISYPRSSGVVPSARFAGRAVGY